MRSVTGLAGEMREHAHEATVLLRAMASEHRLMVLCSLAGGELSVSELMERVPLAQSALSQHLAVLRRERLVRTRREGQTVYYAVEPGPVLDVIQALHAHYCRVPSGHRRSSTAKRGRS